MSQTETAETRTDFYLPAVISPSSRPGPIERVLTAPFRRERAARSRTE